MNSDFSRLVDPVTGLGLRQVDTYLTSDLGETYPIVNGIPRFVSQENYSADFGEQWVRFPKTQLDSAAGIDLSEDRLRRCFRGSLERVNGKTVLEAGSGAGRFTEILLRHGAKLDSFDYSNAVEANAKNNGEFENLLLVQADIRSMPFRKADYDFVVCLGVLQHTPSPEESVRHLWEMVRPGGLLIIDHYLRKWRNVLPPPFGGAEPLYRSLILRLPRATRFHVVKRITDFWFPIHWKFRNSATAQRVLRRVSPVHFYYPQHNLRSRDRYYEWALLDTHDSTTDFYKHHRTIPQIEKLLVSLDSTDITVEVGGNGIEATCRKKQ